MLTESIIETGHGKTVLKIRKWNVIFFASSAKATSMNPNDEGPFFTYIWDKKIEFLMRTPIGYIGKIIILLHFFFFIPNSRCLTAQPNGKAQAQRRLS
jgi:hypothetical protein